MFETRVILPGSGFCFTSRFRSAIDAGPSGKALATQCSVSEVTRQRRISQCMLKIIHYIHVRVGIHDYSSDDAAVYIPPFVIDEVFTIKAKSSQ